jgi:hypothetical protein
LGLHLPPSFGGGNFSLLRATREAITSLGCRKVLLPLKKGGREGFLARDFQRASLKAEVRMKR